MVRITLAAAAVALLGTVAVAADKKEDKVTGPLGYKMKGIDGKEVDLGQYKGKVVLLVNVASKCGYTKQYSGLQALYEKYGKDGLVVIGVPANDFGAQEPGTDDDIQKFCSSTYNVTFPLLSKVSVKGKEITPLYQYLTSKETNPSYAGDIGWNFEKFLISRKGEVVGRFKSGDAPESEKVTSAIKAELDTK
ncbi:MAG: glutathione peroxidase [Gemmataceae bacterium]